MRACSRRTDSFRAVAISIVVVLALTPSLAGQSQTPSAIFRASRELVSIDVIVRDRSGAIVRDLTASDFEIREDGRVQEVLTSSFQEVDATAAPGAESTLLDRLGSTTSSSLTGQTAADLAGHRLVLLLFDLSGMEPEEVERGVQAALKYVDSQMSGADLVAIATLTWQLNVLTDFTGDRTAVRDVLESLVAVDITAGDTSSSDLEPAPTAGSDTVASGTDARLRALRLIADALAPVAQKKALLYFTGGLGNGAQDTPSELRAATTAATKANLAIYPVDTRGLQAIVPGGAARVGSRNGQGAFSGQDVNDQFNELATSQDTMASLASASGGRMFSGVNDLGAAFTRMQSDTGAYYLIGYSSSNGTRDGQFRRVQVRVTRPGVRVEARSGYYGDRDFGHTSRADREAQLEERLLQPSDPSAFDVQLSMAWFRLAADRFRVPVTITMPPLPAPPSSSVVALDILAVVEDEQGRAIARIRDSVNARAAAGQTSALTYMSNVVLPPGRFTVRAVVRENTDGAAGTASTDIGVPLLNNESLVVSAPLLRDADNRAAPSLYVEVYDARALAGGRDRLTVSASFYRDSVRVLQAELNPAGTDVSAAPDAMAFELPLTAGVLRQGRYVCQITVIDPTNDRLALVRTELTIR